MEIKSMKHKVSNFFTSLKQRVIKKSDESEKKEINWNQIKIISLISILLFIGVVLFLPDEESVQFSTKIEPKSPAASGEITDSRESVSENSARLWGSPKSMRYGSSSGREINYNTAMMVSIGSGSSRTQIRPGDRLPLRFLQKVTVAEQAVPVLAELILNIDTESGLSLKAGTKFYGKASYSKGSQRAQVQFTSISLPSGEIKPISGIALSKGDGQPGVGGKVFSDGIKNSAGQVLTTFVGGLAAGSLQTDALGNSLGGVQNGILSAISATAKERAQSYGEKLKAEREWIEIAGGAECDAVLNEALNLQHGALNE